MGKKAEKSREKPKKKLQLYPLQVFEDDEPVGTAFINYIERKTRTLYMIVQIKHPSDRKKVLETFMIRIPLPMTYILNNVIKQSGGIKSKRTDFKWKVAEDDKIISAKRIKELLD